MQVPSDQSPLRLAENEDLKALIIDLIANFGIGKVTAEIRRRPKPRPNGRPKIWDHLGLFTLWLIIQTWALRENGQIESACRGLEKMGGLTYYPAIGNPVILSTSKQIRKMFYKCDTELDEFETRYAPNFWLDRTIFGSLKTRLAAYAQDLRWYEPLFCTHVSMASDIVFCELTFDGMYSEPPDGLSDRPDVAELQEKVTYLKVAFGEEEVKAAIRRLPSKAIGHPKMWYQLRLFTLWFIIQNILQLERITVDGACKRIEEIGGIFEYYDEEDDKVRNQIVFRQKRVRHLYYEAESNFADFDKRYRSLVISNYGGPPFKQRLHDLASELASNNTMMMPVLSIAMLFVLEILRTEGICQQHSFEAPRGTVRVDTSRFKFVPDGKGRWNLHMPGSVDDDEARFAPDPMN